MLSTAAPPGYSIPVQITLHRAAMMGANSIGGAFMRFR
jgi:hypothetical protein